METHYTLGTLIGFPLALLLLAVLVVVAVVGVLMRDGFVFGVFACAAVAVAGLTAAAMWPYDKDFHTIRPVSGVVTETSSRFLAVDKATEQKYVLTIDGQPYGCKDTRCALVEPGDTVTLGCTKTWEWQATPGDDCRYVARTPKS